MARSQFQNLIVYQLAERLADSVWSVVQNWPVFDSERLARRLCEPLIASERTLQKVQDADRISTIDDLSDLLAGHSSRSSTGCEELFVATF